MDQQKNIHYCLKVKVDVLDKKDERLQKRCSEQERNPGNNDEEWGLEFAVI